MGFVFENLSKSCKVGILEFWMVREEIIICFSCFGSCLNHIFPRQLLYNCALVNASVIIF